MKTKSRNLHEFRTHHKDRNITATMSLNPLLLRTTGFGGGSSQFAQSEKIVGQQAFALPTQEPKEPEKYKRLAIAANVGGVASGVVSAYQGYKTIREKYTQLQNLYERYNNGEFDQYLNRVGIRRQQFPEIDDLNSEMGDWDSILGRGSRIGSIIEDDASNLSADDVASIHSFMSARSTVGDDISALPDPADVPIEPVEALPNVPPLPRALELPQTLSQRFQPQPQQNNPMWEDILDRENFGSRSLVRQLASRQRQLELDRQVPSNEFEMGDLEGMAARNTARLTNFFESGQRLNPIIRNGQRIMQLGEGGEELESIPMTTNIFGRALQNLSGRIVTQFNRLTSNLPTNYDEPANFNSITGGTEAQELQLMGEATTTGAEEGANLAASAEASASAVASAETAGESVLGEIGGFLGSTGAEIAGGEVAEDLLEYLPLGVALL